MMIRNWVSSRYTILTVLVALLCFAIASPARADVVNQNGRLASGVWILPGPSECLDVWVTVSASTGMRNGDSSAEVAWTTEAGYFVIDHCTNAYLTTANGTTSVKGSSSVRIAANLVGAQVAVAFPVTDTQTNTILPVVLDVTWSSVGPTYEQKDVTRYVGPDYKYIQRYMSKFRVALPTGTIQVGDVTYDLAQASYVDGYVAVINAGSMNQ